MAHTIGKGGEPYIAASAIGGLMAAAYASGAPERVMPPAALASAPIAGLTLATAATPGWGVTVQRDGRGKAIAAASIAAGRPVTAGSTNGALIEAVPGTSKNIVGIALENAGAGDVFTVEVEPATF